jgi:hypothetical protein
MATPRLIPQIDYLGHRIASGKTPTDRSDAVIEKIVGVPPSTAKAMREALRTYPQNSAGDDGSDYFEIIDNWRVGLNPDVVKLYDWDGWVIVDMAACSYIEKISGAPASNGGHTDDRDEVAAILARNRTALPPGVFPQDLEGLSWG